MCSVKVAEERISNRCLMEDSVTGTYLLLRCLTNSSFLTPFFLVSSFVALQGVVAAERSRGGQLLEEPKMLPFRANTFSLQVCIQDVPQFLWSIKPFTTCQVPMNAANG